MGVGTNLHCTTNQRSKDLIYIMAWAWNLTNYITYWNQQSFYVSDHTNASCWMWFGATLQYGDHVLVHLYYTLKWCSWHQTSYTSYVKNHYSWYYVFSSVNLTLIKLLPVTYLSSYLTCFLDLGFVEGWKCLTNHSHLINATTHIVIVGEFIPLCCVTIW